MYKELLKIVLAILAITGIIQLVGPIKCSPNIGATNRYESAFGTANQVPVIKTINSNLSDTIVTRDTTFILLPSAK
jgi:hypothetical protein